eukprot:SM000115S23916  [mRNA]  locus=s115:179041:179831:+ [translate_table: standard]
MAAEEGLRAPSKLRRICVFCGSSRGAQPTYAAEAVELGREMARRGIGLVYGGGNVGLMGVVSGAVHEAGGQVLGIIPTALMPVEVGAMEPLQHHSSPYGGGACMPPNILRRARSAYTPSPASLLLSGRQQISGQAVGEVRAVANMHDRKAQMAAEADAFIALPGTPLPPPLPQAGAPQEPPAVNTGA